MDVSVIIINYNTFELTSKCISSVYKFTKEITFEIILVDNASTECDAELFLKEFPGITLVRNAENLGFAKGNNSGINVAAGKVILLLNSDVELIENSITVCYKKLMELNNEIGVITCKLIYPDGKVQKQCNRFPSAWLNVLEMLRLHKLFSKEKRAIKFLGHYFDNESDITPDWVWGTFFMFRREVLGKLDGRKLNEDYFMYCEDIRWCYDFMTLGNKCYYYTQTKVIHRLSQSVKSMSHKSEMILYNKLDFITKTRGRLYMKLYGISAAFNILFTSFNIARNRILFKLYTRAIFGLHN